MLGGGTKSGPDFYVCGCFYRNRPLESRFSTQRLIFCLCAGFCEICLTYQAMWAGVPPPKNRCWSGQKQAKVGRKTRNICVSACVVEQHVQRTEAIAHLRSKSFDRLLRLHICHGFFHTQKNIKPHTHFRVFSVNFWLLQHRFFGGGTSAHVAWYVKHISPRPMNKTNMSFWVENLGSNRRFP